MCRYYRCPKYGEYSTQATLNTFHVAGVDTGSSTGVSRFQDLIMQAKLSK